MIDLEVTIGFLLSMEKGNFRQMETLLADEMIFCGSALRPLCKTEFIKLMAAIRAGIPDWKFHFRDVQPCYQSVSMTIEITGTHLRPLRGLLPGMPSHTPTGATFHLPPERIEFTLDDDKITHIHIDPVPGGGIDGMLEQLGILVPVLN